MILKAIQADNLHIEVHDSRESMGRAAGEAAARCLRKILSEQATARVIFAAAPSQNETLSQLVREEGIDWTRVEAFHMDEYIGLTANAPQRFGAYLNEHIFSRVPFACVNYLNGQAANAQEECRRYGALLSERGVDMVCLGIGENGHIAFNDPWVADFADGEKVKVVKLDEVCRQQQVNDGCFAALSDVPQYAMTLTIPTLMSARHLICTVPAATKTQAVTHTVNGEISPKVPATIMRKHADARLFCDCESGKGLL